MLFVLYHCACHNKWDNNRMSGTQLNKYSNMPRRKKEKINNFGEYIYFFTIYVEKDANVSYAEFFITIFFSYIGLYTRFIILDIFSQKIHILRLDSDCFININTLYVISFLLFFIIVI